MQSPSFVRLVWPSLAALLLVANCTVTVEKEDAKGGSSSTNGGAPSGAGGATSANGGTMSSSGGTTATTGGSAPASGGSGVAAGGSSTSGGYAGSATYGGSAGSGPGAAGEGGIGAGGAVGDVCDDCLAMKCPNELDACLSDPRCYNDDATAPGQYQDMVACLDQVRVEHPVKRVDVVDCGIAVGRSAASNSFAWPPDEMAVTTTDLINCMATGQANTPNNSGWSDGDPDVATDPIAQKWVDGSCAKTSCTSQL